MKMLKKMGLGFALAGMSLVAGIVAAQAAPAIATSAVNVRSGPGIGYAVLDTLRAGEIVEVERCSGNWCFVQKSGPDGWVSRNYLAAQSSGNSGAGFSMSFGSGDGSITIGIGGGASQGQGHGNGHGNGQGGWGNKPQQRANVCFFEHPGLQGRKHCVNVGASEYNIQGPMRNRIASIENPAGALTYACTDVGLQGKCQVYSGRVDFVGAQLAGRIVSFKTYYPEF